MENAAPGGLCRRSGDDFSASEGDAIWYGGGWGSFGKRIRVCLRRFQVRNPAYRPVQVQGRHVRVFDARGRRHVRSDGLVLGYGAADGGDLLVFVLLLVRVVRTVLEVRVGYGLRMMVHRAAGRGGRVDVTGGRQSGPKRFRRYVDRVVQRWALFRFRAEV